MTPSSVTDEPTIPVAAAKMVAVIITARYKDPLIPANNCCMAWNRRSIKPDCSSKNPINKKKGIDARMLSCITDIVCKIARSKTIGPKAINPIKIAIIYFTW